MRDLHELVEWQRFKLGIKFTFGVRLSGNGLPEVTDYPTEDSSQVTEDIESGNETVQSGNRLGESGNGLPPLAFTGLSGESELATRASQDETGQQASPETTRETLDPKPNANRYTHTRFVRARCEVCGIPSGLRDTRPCVPDTSLSTPPAELNEIPHAPPRSNNWSRL